MFLLCKIIENQIYVFECILHSSTCVFIHCWQCVISNFYFSPYLLFTFLRSWFRDTLIRNRFWRRTLREIGFLSFSQHAFLSFAVLVACPIPHPIKVLKCFPYNFGLNLLFRYICFRRLQLPGTSPHTFPPALLVLFLTRSSASPCRRSHKTSFEIARFLKISWILWLPLLTKCIKLTYICVG